MIYSMKKENYFPQNFLHGSGRGEGTIYCTGYGDSCGKWDECGIKSYKGHPVQMIDGYPTILKHELEYAAVGYIIHENLTTEKCYLVFKKNYWFSSSSPITAYKIMKE